MGRIFPSIMELGENIDESEFMKLGKIFRDENNIEGLKRLIQRVQPFATSLSKVKASKLVKLLVDTYLELDATSDDAERVCRDCIEWAHQHHRAFLKKSLEVRLMNLYVERQQYKKAINLGSHLSAELKRDNIKDLYVWVQILNTRSYCQVENY